MSRPLLLLIAAVAAPAGGLAAFEKTFGGPHLDRGVFVSPTRDGGYVVVGATRSFGAGNEDVYLLKTDSDAQLLWFTTHGGPETDMGWSVHELSEGFVVAGFTASLGHGGFDFYLVKTDSRGQAIWSKTYGGLADDRAWALLPADDGGFLLVGETESSGAGEEDCLLVKTDASGAEEWSRTYGGEKGDRCFAVAPADDGGWLLAGQTYSEGAGDRDAYVIRTGTDGTLDWSRTFGGAESDVGHSIVATGDGGFMVTGYTSSFAEAEDDPYLIKVDPGGKTLWTRVLKLEGVNHTITGDRTLDAGYCLTGFSRHRAGAPVALLVKTDSEGRLDWHREIVPPGAVESLGYTVRATSDGGCVLTGLSRRAGEGPDLLLVKLPANAGKPDGSAAAAASRSGSAGPPARSFPRPTLRGPLAAVPALDRGSCRSRPPRRAGPLRPGCSRPADDPLRAARPR